MEIAGLAEDGVDARFISLRDTHRECFIEVMTMPVSGNILREGKTGLCQFNPRASAWLFASSRGVYHPAHNLAVAVRLVVGDLLCELGFWEKV